MPDAAVSCASSCADAWRAYLGDRGGWPPPAHQRDVRHDGATIRRRGSSRVYQSAPRPFLGSWRRVACWLPPSWQGTRRGASGRIPHFSPPTIADTGHRRPAGNRYRCACRRRFDVRQLRVAGHPSLRHRDPLRLLPLDRRPCRLGGDAALPGRTGLLRQDPRGSAGLAPDEADGARVCLP